MADQGALQKLFVARGFPEFCWIDPREIVVARWVRMKYLYGCDSYGSAANPADMPGPDDCRAFFEEYRLGVLFHLQEGFSDPDERHVWSRDINRALVELERSVYVGGSYKAFLIFMDKCNLCRECAVGRAGCRNKKMARPNPESLGVDVAATAAKYGFTLGTVENEREINRAAILLIE